MSYQFPPDIADMVQQQIAAGYFDNEDDVLRFALGNMPSDDEYDEEDDEIDSLQQAIQEAKNGDTGRPAEEVFADLKARYKL
jgi:Arc/MetJ-type ribon-helix-helix transcriptional regulator